MNKPAEFCHLCGLPLHYQKTTLATHGGTFHFCCLGCRQVFHLLLESSDQADSESFKDTELFKKCQEIGIIPRSEAELAQRSPQSTSTTVPQAGLTREQDYHEPAGHESSLSLSLNVTLMWCPACAWVIEETLKKTPGVLSASCNFATDRVRCDYDPVLTSPHKIVDSINSLGFKAYVPGDDADRVFKRAEFIRLLISAFLTMNVMMLSFALYSGFFTHLSRDTIHKLSWPMFVMATVVFFYGGRNIYWRAWTGIFSAAFSMETLITVGSFSAYFYSIYGLLSGSIHLYFDTASMLITLVLLGKLLEGRAKSEVHEDLANFFSLRPTKVKICSKQYPQGRYVAAENLRQGDIFRVEETEILPADGFILQGAGTVDESSLTGEPLPVIKKDGDLVRSGSKVIKGALEIRAERVGEESLVGQMITIMETALAEKTPFEGKAERALQWFVPLIISLAVGTGFFCLLAGLTVDQAMIRAVTVMVISCPCTLGIAIPMARVAGISLAGRKGILVRDFSSFEQADRVNTFVLDKTGTVTKGQWALLEIIALDSLSEAELLGMAASLENASDHLIAAEIIREAAKRKVRPVSLDTVEIFENGVSGVFSGKEAKIGSRGFLASELEAGPNLPVYQDKPEHSLVYMSYAGRVCGVFVFGDELKPNAIPAMNLLHSSGYRLALVSGDDDQTTKAFAREVGIDEAQGGKLPREKANFISTLQQQGQLVAMVGDGINDAPALVQADLAIAVHSGSNLSEEAADLTLMRGDPLQIGDFVHLAKEVKKKIYQNLGFSFLYNLVSIPIAMSGLLSPLFAVCAMLLSSLSVIGNTLLLLKKG